MPKGRRWPDLDRRHSSAATSLIVVIANGLGWSPEQIANRLQIDFPDDSSMRISHEAIYQAFYIQGRGALKRELVSYLRTGPVGGIQSRHNGQRA